MTDSAFLDWKSKLDYAHRYWDANGLTAAPQASNSAARFVEFYRGNQWSNWGFAGLAPDECITVNVTFANTNAMISRLSKKNPEPIVTPKRRTSNDSAKARRNELLLRYFNRELKMKRQVDRALLDALLGPFGVIQHFITSHIEKYDKDGVEIETYSQARPNLPGIRRRAWWDVRIDPLAETFEPDGTATWVAFRDLMTMEQIAAHPRLVTRDDLRPTKSIDLAMGQPQTNKTRTQIGDPPEWSKLVEVWWVYDKTDKTFFAISPGSEKPLMEPDDWPVPWEALPYSYLAFNEQVDSNVPLPFPQSYEKQQTELNKNRTLIAELAKRLRRVVLGQRGAFTEADQKRLESGDIGLTEFFFVDGSLSEAVGQVQLGVFPQELLLYDNLIKTDIRETMGLSQMDRGQRINVQSATEAGNVQMGSDVQSSRPEEKFEDFWADVLRRFHQSLRYQPIGDILVPIVGMADAAALGAEGDFINVNAENIQGEFDINIRQGSTLPEDHNQLFAKSIQLYSLLKDNPVADQIELVRVAIEESGFDSKRLVQPPAAVVETQNQLTNMGLGGGMNGGKQGAPKAAGNTGGLDANFLRTINPQGSS